MKDFWSSCVSSLSKSFPPELVRIWLEPLRLRSFDDESFTLTITAPNTVKQNWARANFNQPIHSFACDWFKLDDVKVVFVIEKTANIMPMSSLARASTSTKDINASTASSLAKEGEMAQSNQSAQSGQMSQTSSGGKPIGSFSEYAFKIDPEKTLENMVEGDSNKFALAAAASVINNPGIKDHNPLYVYGGTGLGKSHLVQAIANKMQNGSMNILYITADSLFNEYVNATKTNSVDKLRDYYQRLDVLLIDDIQFLGNKENTQNFLFHAYESLVSRNKQIVIVSDTYPRELKNINDRLRSRFESGLKASIDPPSIELRVAILKKKVESMPQYELTDECAFFIAKHVKSSVRDLEGAIRQVIACAGITNTTKFTIDICREALVHRLSSSAAQLTVESIQRTVADYFGVTIKDINSKRRTSNLVTPRQIAMYLSKELTNSSYPEIGRVFGDRDHTTVLHAVRKIEKTLSSDNELNHKVNVLRQTLKG